MLISQSQANRNFLIKHATEQARRLVRAQNMSCVLGRHGFYILHVGVEWEVQIEFLLDDPLCSVHKDISSDPGR